MKSVEEMAARLPKNLVFTISPEASATGVLNPINWFPSSISSVFEVWVRL